jgi:hypothetical protein
VTANTATATSHTPGVNPNDTDNDAAERLGDPVRPDPNPALATTAPAAILMGRPHQLPGMQGSSTRFFITYLGGATGTFSSTRIALANRPR